MKYKCGSKNRALKLICEDAIAWEESLIDALTPKSYYGPATGSAAEAIEKAKLVISDAKAILRGITSNAPLERLSEEKRNGGEEMTDETKQDGAPEGQSASKAMLEGKLTPEQVENWRNLLLVLLGTIGPYALITPVEQVQKMRDRFQEQANNLPSNAALSGWPGKDETETEK